MRVRCNFRPRLGISTNYYSDSEEEEEGPPTGEYGDYYGTEDPPPYQCYDRLDNNVDFIQDFRYTVDGFMVTLIGERKVNNIATDI